MLLPGTLQKVAKAFEGLEGPAMVFGDCMHFEDGNRKCRGSEVATDQPFNLDDIPDDPPPAR